MKINPEIAKLIDRSILQCKVIDIIQGKIPDSFLKDRYFLKHFLFIHEETQRILYPAKLFRYIPDETGTHQMYEHESNMAEDDLEVYIRKVESLREIKEDINKYKAINFNKAYNNDEILDPIFNDMETNQHWIWGGRRDITMYFINEEDFVEYENYLKKTIVI